MLGILFTAASSTDVVKDLQDKVISLHEHEVSFLNDTIANMLTVVGIGVAIITAFFSWAYVYVRNSNKQAQEKMAEAQEQLEIAERKNGDLDQKMTEANQILTHAKSMANTAQEKLTELEREQEEIKKSTELLEMNFKMDFLLERNKQNVELIKEKLRVFLKDDPIRPEFVKELLSTCHDLDVEFNRLKLKVAQGLSEEKIIGIHEEIFKFDRNCEQLKTDYLNLENEIFGITANK